MYKRYTIIIIFFKKTPTFYGIYQSFDWKNFTSHTKTKNENLENKLMGSN